MTDRPLTEIIQESRIILTNKPQHHEHIGEGYNEYWKAIEVKTGREVVVEPDFVYVGTFNTVELYFARANR